MFKMKIIWITQLSAEKLFCVLTVYSILFVHSAQSTWWYLSLASSAYQNNLISTKEHYRTKCLDLIPGTPRYIEECQGSRDILDVVKSGAAMAMEECQYQFRGRRWNCTSFNDTLVFGGVLDMDTREKAYIYSISSAGVMHAITKACAKGELSICGCDQRVAKRNHPSSDFMWGGCSDDVNFGYKYTSDWVDNNEDTHNAPGLMNLWNNDAGRMTVKRNLKRVCKCHGVSASCEVKICWRAMPSFQEVGEHLKDRFEGASRVKLAKRKLKLRPITKEMKRPTHQDLVYLEDSPSYCEFDPDKGILGTQGRLCNKTSEDVDGCKLMCCGRGYRTIVRTVEEDCECQFFWCCEVKCQKCEKEIEEHFCN